jgi:TonB-dependent receptor
VLVALVAIGTSAVALAQPLPETGTIAGVVTDAALGAPLESATIVLSGPAGSESAQQLRTTRADGRFAFEAVRAGTYQLEFTRVGYAASSIAALAVLAGRESRADQALSERLADSQSQSETGPIEEIKVRGDPTADLLGSIETRAQSDELVNVLGAEDLSKFAAVDMADALKRVSGVNVVEGQFAIIRGLEDRYSSTLYNGAPVPSPDPDRQSVQLDLFPAEIVNQVVVSKTFGQELPSNSSGGSIDVRTPELPENPLEIAVSAKAGINENAYDRFFELEGGNPVGNEQKGLGALESEYGGAIKGRTSVLEREVRYKVVANWGNDYVTEEGFQEGRQPAKGSSHFPAADLAYGDLSLSDGRFDLTTSDYSDQLALYGGVGFDIDELSDHTVDASIFYTRKNSEAVQLRENGSLPGFDYGAIREKWVNGEDIDASSFDGSTAFFRPGVTGSYDAWIGNVVQRANPGEATTRGLLWYASMYDSRSFDIGRDLAVYQLQGDHILDLFIDGLHVEWTGNYATTTQEETSLGARFAYEPCRNDDVNVFNCPSGVTPINDDLDATPTSIPTSVRTLGPGSFLARRGLFLSDNDIEEEQYFGRFDGDYEIEPLSWLTAKAQSGVWYEHAERDVTSSFLSGDRLSIECPNPAVQGCVGSGTQYVIFGDTAQQMGSRIFTTALPKGSDGVLDGLLSSRNESMREISAVHVGAKTTFWEDLDVLGGLRLENIFIETKNDPFSDQLEFDQTPRIFPSKYLFFDRLDNPARLEPTQPPPYNSDILGIDVPRGLCRDLAGQPIPGGGQCVDLVDRAEIASLINGEIDENYALPSAAIAYHPFRWLTLRGAYSETVARPSFRELGYYVSAEPGTDDLTVGNPQLGLSEVESWDARVEFVWGNYADLFAVSLFQKDIEDPIEQIVVRDPSIFEDSATDTFRTFFNNPSKGKIRGIELETRLNLSLVRLDFLDVEVPGRPYLDFLEYLSVGGNYSYFDAEVRRSRAELARSTAFFFPSGTPTGPTPYRGLERKRRLYGQPEWIANADISFDHPLWGTKVTLAFFAISDLLDAAGVASPDQSGSIRTFTLDRYIDSYEQLDLVISQELWRGFAVKFSAKNLTDSKRAIVYDPDQTAHRVPEREYRRGRDYSLALTWTF